MISKILNLKNQRFFWKSSEQIIATASDYEELIKQ